MSATAYPVLVSGSPLPFVAPQGGRTKPCSLPARHLEPLRSPVYSELHAAEPADTLSPLSPFTPARTEDVGVVILAAGFSSRMGAFKPLLPVPDFGGELSALELLLRRYTKLGVRHIVVVSGHNGCAVDAVVRSAGGVCVRNSRPEDGMFSSVRLGLGCLPSGCGRVFIHPVDIPLVRTLTLRRLLCASEMHPDAVCLPVFSGARGHPPLLPATTGVIERICRSRGECGLRSAISFLPRVQISVPDRMMLQDMDTDADYATICQLAKQTGGLTPGEAHAFLDAVHISGAVRDHCRAVGVVARAMALALYRAGWPCNADTAYSGGLLHDLLKGVSRHDKAIETFLNECELPEMASICGGHMDLVLPECSGLTEREVVFLADKHVSGTRPVPLEERYRKKLTQFADQPEVLAAIIARKERAMRVEHRFAADSGREPLQLTREALGRLSGTTTSETGLIP